MYGNVKVLDNLKNFLLFKFTAVILFFLNFKLTFFILEICENDEYDVNAKHTLINNSEDIKYLCILYLICCYIYIYLYIFYIISFDIKLVIS